jgi:hypothetical protein
MTWAPPIEKLKPLLNELDQKHPDIRITTTSGLNVHFLNAYIENQKGKLHNHLYYPLFWIIHVYSIENGFNGL